MADTRHRRGCFFPFLFFVSIVVNAALLAYLFWPTADEDEPALIETHLYGPKTQTNKIAVVRAEGPLAEGLDSYILKQIEQAGSDKDVKGVVLRIDSPGGTIGSSEHVHRELTRLRTGKNPRHKDWSPKPLVASMGSIAASGGYYIAMPAEKVLAEKGTLTGSIGVFAALPNVSGWTKEHGIHLELVKAGAIKGSGSPLHEMTPAERQPWQDMVDSAYDQFLDVVVAGRPKLSKEQLRSEVVSRKQASLYDDKGNVKSENGKAKQVEVTRYRADGGTFTANEAKQFGLIDDIGLLEDAVAATASSAGVSDYRVVAYQRQPTLLTALLGIRAESATPPRLQDLSASLRPRIWYMAPGNELSGVVAASMAAK